ncbi:MAG: porin [Acidobacteriota bacterium]
MMMETKRTAILLFSLVLTFTPNLFVWGQDKNEPKSEDYTQKLEKRLQILEQTVRELQEKLESRTSSTESPSKAEAPQVPKAATQPVVQDAPKRDHPMKFSGYLFGDYYWVGANHDNSLEDQNGFWIRRIYLTFDKPLTETIDARLRFEMNSAGDFRSRSKLDPFVKDAYVRWKFSGGHQAYIGLSSTPTWDVVEKVWGYRSVEKTALDLQKMGSSRDLGVAFKGSLDSGKKVRYHFMLANGSGTRSEIDEGKKTLFSLGFYPTDSVILEFYSDYDNRPQNADRRTFQGFLAYQREWGRLGVQYAHQIRDGTPDLKLDALSFFGVYKLSPRVSLFGRYDRMFDPNPEGAKISYIPFDPSAKSHLFLGGIDLKVCEEFSLMPNVEVVRYDKLGDGTRPGTDFIPRVTFFYRF